MVVDIVTAADLAIFQEKIQTDLGKMMERLQQIGDRMEQLNKRIAAPDTIQSGYLPALDYMRTVGIKRWKFDQLIAGNKIRAVKKKRKIYVPVGEVERYFKDPSIQ